MGADAETLNQWTPAPALVADPEWTREGSSWVARSANGRFVCTVTHNGDRLGMPWNYTNRFDGKPVANFNDMTEEGAKRRALDQLAAWRRTKPDTTERPAPALIGEWRTLASGALRWMSPCGRVDATVWYNTHDKDWRYVVDSPGRGPDMVGYPASTREIAQTEAINDARGRLAELDKAAPPSEPSKWHPIADDIAATVAEKNAAYGDSFAKAGDILAILYPTGIAPNQYADALAVVRVVDKLFRVATDRDAFGESPWRDIAGYALLACERVGK